MSSELISYRGRYKWRLFTHDLYEGVELEIDWGKFLLEVGGSKYERSRLITSSKNFILMRMDHPIRKWRSSLSAASVMNWFKQLRSLVHWMTEREIWQYSALTSADVIEFLKSRTGRHANRIPSKKSLQSHVDLLDDLWSLRQSYEAPIRINIKLFEDEIWQKCKVRENRAWRATEEGFALALIADGIHWIQHYGPFFVETAEYIYAAQSKWVGLTSARKAKLSKVLFADVCNLPVFKEISEMVGCGLNAVGFTRAFTITVGAAINVLLFMIGQRASELVRLDEGCLDNRIDSYGQPISYIHGVAAKKNGLAREWVAGDPIPEIIKWLENLNRTARQASGLKALLISRTQGSSIPLPGRKVHRMSAVSPVTAMRAFANAPFRADRPKTKNLHPHAARKTFAEFVVRRDKSALGALSLHFGHAYRAFTDGAYAGNMNLMQLLTESDRNELARTLSDLLKSPHLAGKAANSVLAYRQSNTRFRGKLVLERSVRQLISQGIQVAPCNWGYCLYSQPLSACGGDPKGPNELNRSPEVCSGCTNFVVTDAHSAWWNQRIEADELFLKSPSISPQTKEIVEKRLHKSRSILRELISSRTDIVN